jgi:glyoxylase-like metal-dependent hydrolase (beta-lactamase superfamily II)
MEYVRHPQFSRCDHRFAPGEHERPWPPTSSTLIYGLRDAVLVDSFITLEQARAQVDWIASTGKNLTTIYATHGHGDHFFGASVLLDRFPKARFVAAPSVIQVMKEQASPEFVAKFWESRFPHQLPKHLVVAEELRTNLIELEGERLVVIPLGFTDTVPKRALTNANVAELPLTVQWSFGPHSHPQFSEQSRKKSLLID